MTRTTLHNIPLDSHIAYGRRLRAETAQEAGQHFWAGLGALFGQRQKSRRG